MDVDEIIKFLNLRSRVYVFLYNKNIENTISGRMLEYCNFSFVRAANTIELEYCRYNKENIKDIKSGKVNIILNQDMDITQLKDDSFSYDLIRDILQTISDFSKSDFFIYERDKCIDYIKPSKKDLYFIRKI